MLSKRSSRGIAGLALTMLMVSAATAEVKLPAMFSDHMVLQRDVSLPVWGWAEPGEHITVSLAGRSATATADDDGNWSLRLAPMASGGPHRLTVKGGNTIEIEDVLVGEVWLCSGQSNMAMTVSRCAGFEAERVAARYPQIRMLTVPRETAETPQSRCKGSWEVCSSETVGDFSATAYFFGRELHRELDVPIGLLHSSWGGTPVEAWTAMEDQRARPELRSLLGEWKERVDGFDPAKAEAEYKTQLARWEKRAAQARKAGEKIPRKPRKSAHPGKSPRCPASLYNGMITPLAPYALRGVIWYQGEANTRGERSKLYGLQLGMMIANWRRDWGQGEFPFLYVQLPNFRDLQTEPVQTDGWVIVQEQMLKTLALAGTGMAVTIDIGEAGDVHPKNKQDVGRRLATWALARIYGQDRVACGPLYRSMSIQDGSIRVAFDHVVDGLKVRGGEALKGFAIAGADRKFVWAQARIEGEEVILSSPAVASPVAVRYAWASNPIGNLSNQAGLPASPFRTDDWEL